MRTFSILCALALVLGVFSACSSTGSGISGSIPNGGKTDSMRSYVAPLGAPPLLKGSPPPAELVPVSQLHPLSIANHVDPQHVHRFRPQGVLAPPNIEQFATSRVAGRTMRPESIVNSYDAGGQAGLAINQSYDDIYASVTGFTPSNVPIAYPGAGTGSTFDTGNILATVVHAGRSNMDGTTNCLEAGSVYETNDGNGQQPSATFAVGNFCSNPNSSIEDFPIQIPIDFNFQNTYERNLGDGLPKYTVELYQPIGGDGSWHAIIWNYSNNNWEDLGHWYSTYPASRDNAVTYGWALIESHYYPGPCSSFYGTMSISNIQVAVETGNDSQNYFRNPNSGDVAFDPLNNGYPHQCFVNDNSGLGAVYNFTWTSYPYAWNATDPRPGPTPTPRPQPTPNPCKTNPRLCLDPIRTPTPAPTRSPKP